MVQQIMLTKHGLKLVTKTIPLNDKSEFKMCKCMRHLNGSEQIKRGSNKKPRFFLKAPHSE